MFVPNVPEPKWTGPGAGVGATTPFGELGSVSKDCKYGAAEEIKIVLEKTGFDKTTLSAGLPAVGVPMYEPVLKYFKLDPDSPYALENGLAIFALEDCRRTMFPE